jgi:hypothetical protein
MHYYRMIAERGKDGKKGKKGYDPMSQYEFMSREDLKAMILKEKTEREKAEKKPDETLSGDSYSDPGQVQNQVEKAPSESSGEQALTIPLTGDKKADMLIKILLPTKEEIEKAKEEEETTQPKRPGHKYIDKVERSILSNELPEEFRKKSKDN